MCAHSCLGWIELFQTGGEDTGVQVLRTLQNATGTAEDKLRLLCTYYWQCDAIDSGQLSECVAAVKRAGGDEHALNFLVRRRVYAVDNRALVSGQAHASEHHLEPSLRCCSGN